MSLMDRGRQVTICPRTGRKIIRLAPAGSVMAHEAAKVAPKYLPQDWHSGAAVERHHDRMLQQREAEERAAYEVSRAHFEKTHKPRRGNIRGGR